jgi:2-polyprenyl-6-methoxyphenol hydroxylase-like FAD-dependent oxidoreductase
MVNRTVLISGAGIGGPALAFWLRRYGFAPTVVEVASAPRPGGHAVDLITGLAEDGDGVKVTFASGTVRRFDMGVAFLE